jgi:hypothetical protein
MNFNKYSDLVGLHAFLGASNYHWLNYDEQKVVDVYRKQQAIKRGTELHNLACDLIRLGVKLPETKATLNRYVNDAIGFHMTPEQILYYSPNAFGTADTIDFRQNVLRIHDYKSGESRVSMNQLLIYAALFCLEYKVRPNEIDTELRIYQSNDIVVLNPDPESIFGIMEKIIRFDKLIEDVKLGG